MVEEDGGIVDGIVGGNLAGALESGSVDLADGGLTGVLERRIVAGVSEWPVGLADGAEGDLVGSW